MTSKRKPDRNLLVIDYRIEEGQYYEAHQQLRVVASRLVKQRDYDAAIETLYSGAKSLLNAGQGGSGGDICLFLIDVFKTSELKPSTTSKGKVLSLLRLFPHQEPTRKRFIGEMISWSSTFGEFPAGDPELHHVAGAIYAEENDAYDAERHLLLGTRDSVTSLARLEYDWYRTDESHTAALYAARAVLPYLLLGNFRDASTSFRLFTNWLREDSKSLGVQEVSSSSFDLRVFPSLPLMNFLGLLLLGAQRGSADVFRLLIDHYTVHLRESASWDEALEQIGEMYYDVRVKRQSNPLFDMMGSLFGGEAGGGQGQPRAKSRRIESSAPAAPELD
ncbi:MAG: hypothetical protein M1825_003678 [Sarcosagium campestre]|nr:MAG: hypothetical protein M1825_003678 [Sarcosagium campestre]